ncbi:MAG: hypothetical protein MJ252_17950 [archaeon]|nr:hypothetical protein [archaeon]
MPELKINEDNLIFSTCDCFAAKEISLKEFFKFMIEKDEDSLPNCSNSEIHGDKKAEFYCGDCGEVFCSECLVEHQKSFGNHLRIFAAGVELPLKCQNCFRNLNEKEIFFYCRKCRMYFCDSKECKEKHKGAFHQIVNLKEFLKVKKAEKFKENLDKLKSDCQNDFKRTETVITKVEKLAKKFRTDFERLKKENSRRIQFYESLYSAYLSTLNIPNFHSLQNLVDNEFVGNFHRREIKKILDEMNNNISEIINSCQRGLTQFIDLPKLSLVEEFPRVFPQNFELFDITLSKEGKIYVAGNTPDIYIFRKSLGKFQYVSNFKADEGFVLSVYDSKSFNSLITIGSGTTLNFWDKTNLKLISSLAHGYDVRYQVLETKKGELVLYGEDCNIKVWTDDLQAKALLQGHTHPILSAIEVKDNHIVAKDAGGRLRLWNLNNCFCVKSIKFIDGNTSLSGDNMLYIPESNSLVVGSEKGFISIIDLIHFECKNKIQVDFLGSYDIRRIIRIDDGRYCVGLNIDTSVAVLDYDFSNNSRFNMANHVYDRDVLIRSLIKYSQDTFISANKNGNIRIWKC